MDQILEKPTTLFPTRISSRAIIGGTLVALAIDLVIMVLGGAIGASGHPRATGTIGAGTEIGYIICHIVALSVGAFLGGWTAAAASRSSESRDAFLHALITWAGLIVISVFIMTGLYARSALYLIGGPVTISKPAVVALLWGSFIAFVLTLASAIAGALVGYNGERESLLSGKRAPQPREPVAQQPGTTVPTY